MGGREGDGRAGGGWAGGRGVGGGGGGWEAEGGPKQPFRLKEQCCTFNLWHKLLQCTKEAKTGERSSLVPHAVLSMHPRAMKCTLVVYSIDKRLSVKADLAIYCPVLGASG